MTLNPPDTGSVLVDLNTIVARGFQHSLNECGRARNSWGILCGWHNEPGFNWCQDVHSMSELRLKLDIGI
jgi:hypothetical protein